jgi:uncharacterized protein YecE (DUF72 family)
MKGLPLVIEFRHKSWLDEEHREDTFRFLRENGLGYAVVDEPKLRSLAPFVPEATSDLAYVRLHGRSRQWFDSDAGRRYDYFYSDDELRIFLDPVRSLADRTQVTSVLFNNCHAGASVKNALRFRQLLLS